MRNEKTGSVKYLAEIHKARKWKRCYLNLGRSESKDRIFFILIKPSINNYLRSISILHMRPNDYINLIEHRAFDGEENVLEL